MKVDSNATAAAGARNTGRSHIQQDLRHMVKHVRKEMKAELRELKDAGSLDPSIARELRGMVRDFSENLNRVFHEAGQGSEFNATKIPEGLREAMVALTETLAVFNGRLETPEDGPDTTPEPTVPDTGKAGQLLDVSV